MRPGDAIAAFNRGKLADYPINPNIALVSMFMCAPTDEEARQKAATVEWPAAGLRVGIVWAGNAGHVKDRYRSLRLTSLEPLLRTAGVHFFSLQMGPEAAQLAAIEAPITDLGQGIGDMADTAALISHLDLVIAVDTSVVHLAGALGKPVWVMLPISPDWRWRLDREDSPWYPTMRLFRQPKFDDWHSVVQRVCVALQNECAPDGGGEGRESSR